MDLPSSDMLEILESIPQEEIVEELIFLRSEKVKLSELKIEQRTFKYLKKLGVYNAFIPSEEKKWLMFNFTEQIVLRIGETLWKYGFDAEMIKSVVNVLISDNWVLDFINNKLLQSQFSALSILNSKRISFLEYCIIEKQESPNLRTFTNLDAVIIAAFSSDEPFSMIFNQSGEWGIYSNLFSEGSNSQYKKSLFKNTFVSITFKEILDELIYPKRESSVILNPNLAGKKRMDTLISKGFDYKTLRELEIDSEKVVPEVIEHPISTNIGKLKSSYSNHDILIKVRNSKVSSIKQLVLKSIKNQ